MEELDAKRDRGREREREKKKGHGIMHGCIGSIDLGLKPDDTPLFSPFAGEKFWYAPEVGVYYRCHRRRPPNVPGSRKVQIVPHPGFLCQDCGNCGSSSHRDFPDRHVEKDSPHGLSRYLTRRVDKSIADTWHGDARHRNYIGGVIAMGMFGSGNPKTGCNACLGDFVCVCVCVCVKFVSEDRQVCTTLAHYSTAQHARSHANDTTRDEIGGQGGNGVDWLVGKVVTGTRTCLVPDLPSYLATYLPTNLPYLPQFRTCSSRRPGLMVPLPCGFFLAILLVDMVVACGTSKHAKLGSEIRCLV